MTGEVRMDGRPPIGARLKAAREARRRTLADVAEAAGLTKGFLSKLERDRANASVAALLRVCASLGLPPGSLFEDAPGGEVVRRGAYPAIEFGGAGMREYLLTPPGERRVQAILGELDAGGGSGGERYALRADVEFVFVLDGRVQLTVEDEVTELGPGDAFTFAPSRQHSFRAPEPARVLWVMSPALPADGRAAG
jgi:transcriptional regulator with XRE-family HTH domain